MTLALAILYPLGLFATTWRTVPSGKVSPPRSGPTAAADEAGNTWLFGGYAEEEGKPRGAVNDLMRYSAASDSWERLQQPTDGNNTHPGGRLASACAVSGAELLLFGGWDPIYLSIW